MLYRSQIVRMEDFRSYWLRQRAAEMDEDFQIHRKLWEFAVIAQIYKERIGHGGRVLGFGCGREPLPAWFAAQDARVLATDRPDVTWQWSDTGQHGIDVTGFYRPNILSNEIVDQR